MAAIGLRSDNDEHTQEPLQPEEEEEGKDDLGYYPDGNKRTLTDYQIAMFRHSEIYSLMRAEQIRKENREANGQFEKERLGSHSHGVSIPQDSSEPDAELRHPIDRHASKTASMSELQGVESMPPLRNHKRKRDENDRGDNPSRSYTSRRLARELDATTADDCVLDYGDEPAAESSTHAHPVDVVQDSVEESKQKDAPIQGKKIWWPFLDST